MMESVARCEPNVEIAKGAYGIRSARYVAELACVGVELRVQRIDTKHPKDWVKVERRLSQRFEGFERRYRKYLHAAGRLIYGDEWSIGEAEAEQLYEDARAIDKDCGILARLEGKTAPQGGHRLTPSRLTKALVEKQMQSDDFKRRYASDREKTTQELEHLILNEILPYYGKTLGERLAEIQKELEAFETEHAKDVAEIMRNVERGEPIPDELDERPAFSGGYECMSSIGKRSLNIRTTRFPIIQDAGPRHTKS